MSNDSTKEVFHLFQQILTPHENSLPCFYLLLFLKVDKEVPKEDFNDFLRQIFAIFSSSLCNTQFQSFLELIQRLSK